MALQIPNLDDRRFQDLVDESRRLIPRYCPRWTDHNLSDPGITLLELFAGLVETLIYRLNRLPDKSYIAFMDLMGVRLEPPVAATAQLTFWLSAPLGADAQAVPIPADTEVATVQGPAGRSVSFSTDVDRVCSPPRPLACLAMPEGGKSGEIRDVLRADNQDALAVFSDPPRPGDSFALVDAHDLSGHVLALTFSAPIQGFGIDPTNPPRVWEAWCAGGWERATVEEDGTGGFNREGRVVLHLPQRMAPREQAGASGYWIRCRYTPPAPGQKGYDASPKIQSVRAATLGLAVAATHSTTVFGEILGRSSGEPGQVFQLENAPLLQRRKGELVEVLDQLTWEPWTECQNFAATRPSDTHYTLDSISGEVRFGPRIREPDGSERQYGAIPPAGSMIRMARYRTGGGTVGNVGSATLTVLKTALPYVDRVSNRAEAAGGLDAETLERARLRVPQMLRTSERAVTPEDYEYLAIAAGAGVRRALCVQPGATGDPGLPPAGTVRLFLVPAVEPADRGVTRERLSLAERPAMAAAVKDYLDRRRMLTTVLEIGEPAYVPVSVEARINVRDEADGEAVVREAVARLEAFLNPLVGGPDRAGWPFGRSLYISEIYAVLQSVPGVAYLQHVALRREGAPPQDLTVVELPPEGLVVSAAHTISLV